MKISLNTMEKASTLKGGVQMKKNESPCDQVILGSTQATELSGKDGLSKVKNYINVGATLKDGLQTKKNEGRREQVTFGSTHKTGLPHGYNENEYDQVDAAQFLGGVGVGGGFGALLGGLLGLGVPGCVIPGSIIGLAAGAKIGSKLGFFKTLYSITGGVLGAAIGGLSGPLGVALIPLGAAGGAYGGWRFAKDF